VDETPTVRVLHLLPHLERGGTQRWVIEMIEACRRYGLPIEHHVVALGDRNEMSPEFEGVVARLHRITVDGRSRWPTVYRLRHLLDLADELSIDVIQTHSRFDRPYAYTASLVSKRVVVNTLHSEFAAQRYGHGPGSAKLRDIAEARLEAVAGPATIAVSAHLFDLRRPVGRAKRAPTLAAAPLVDPRFFEVEAKLWSGTGLRLVSVARLVPAKGLDHLVRALPLVRRLSPDATLTIVGDGPDRDRLRSIVDSSGLGSAVELLGDRSDVAAELGSHHIFVLPTASEGLGKAVIEAACVGLGICVPRLPSLEMLLGGLHRTTYIEKLTPEYVAAAIIENAALPAQVRYRAEDVARLRESLDGQKATGQLYAFYRDLVLSSHRAASHHLRR
jgi:glycosyltransferase involved in cell wall biosynthesis